MALTYTQALLDRATAYVARSLASRRYAEGLAEISSLYSAITGSAVACRQCQYSDFMSVVQAYIREATRFLHPETMSDSSYTFAPAFAAEIIADGRYGKSVTAENLTDDDAKALIPLGYSHVIIAKPGKEAPAEGGETQAQEGDEQPQPTDRETELEQSLSGQKAAYEKLEGQFKLTEENRQQAAANLEKEKIAHRATEKQLKASKAQLTDLTKERDELALQVAELTAKLATPPAEAEPTTPTEPVA